MNEKDEKSSNVPLLVISLNSYRLSDEIFSIGIGTARDLPVYYTINIYTYTHTDRVYIPEYTIDPCF